MLSVVAMESKFPGFADYGVWGVGKPQEAIDKDRALEYVANDTGSA